MDTLEFQIQSMDSRDCHKYQPIVCTTWKADDEPLCDLETLVHIFGKTQSGISIVLEVPFRPYIRLQVNEMWTADVIDRLCKDLVYRLRLKSGDISYTIGRFRHFMEWQDNPEDQGKTSRRYPYVTLEFTSVRAMKLGARLLLSSTDKTVRTSFGTFEYYAVFEHTMQVMTQFQIKAKVLPSSFITVNVRDGLLSEKIQILESTEYKVHSNPIVTKCATQSTGFWQTGQLNCPRYSVLRVLDVSLIDRVNTTAMAGASVLSFDLECFSANNRFPKANKRDDVIIMIGSVLRHFDFSSTNVKVAEGTVSDGKQTVPEAKDQRIVFTLTGHPRIKEVLAAQAARERLNQLQIEREKLRLSRQGKSAVTSNQHSDEYAKKVQEADEQKLEVGLQEQEILEKKKPLEIREFDNELDMIRAWSEWVRSVDPDYIIGHNIHGFDFKYLAGRMGKWYPDSLKDIFRFSRYPWMYTPIEIHQFGSRAFRTRVMYRPDTPGRIQLDTVTWIPRNHQLQSYTLSFIARHFLGDDKLDVSPWHIFKYFISGQKYLIHRIARYCAKDCDLPILLLANLNALPNLISMSRISNTNIDLILYRGQQEKIFNLIGEECSRDQRIINYVKPYSSTTEESAAADEDEENTLVSLFPGMIQKECPKAAVKEPEPEVNDTVNGADLIDDQDTASVGDEEAEDDAGGNGDSSESKRKDRDLALSRGDKQYQGAIVFEPLCGFYKDPIAVLDFASMYPYNMRANNLCPSTLIRFTKANNPGNLFVRLLLFTNAVESLGLFRPKEVPLKVQSTSLGAVYPPDLLGETKSVLRIIYDYMVPEYITRPNFSVRYNLILINDSISTSTNSTGTSEQGNPKKQKVTKSVQAKFAAASKMKGLTGIVQSQTVPVAKSITPVHAAVEVQERIENEDYDNSSVYYCFVGHIEGIIPRILKRLLDARDVIKAKIKALVKKNPKAATTMEYLLLDVEQNSLKITANSIYGFTGVSEEQARLPCVEVAASTTAGARKQIDQTQRIVRDRFNAKIIYGDTDSVMVQFVGRTDRKLVAALGKEAADFITSTFKGRAKLTYEKLYHPYLLLAKKRYAGLMCKPDETPTIHSRGLSIRRDLMPETRKLMDLCIEKICSHAHGYIEAMEYIKTIFIPKFVRHELPLEAFIITKTLAPFADYAKPEDMVQCAVVQKMKARTPGSEPTTGDRVPYVIMLTENASSMRFSINCTGGKKSRRPFEDKLAQQAEDPEYVRIHGRPLDMVYYLDSHVRQPLTRLFQFFKDACSLETLFDGAKKQLTIWSRAQLTQLSSAGGIQALSNINIYSTVSTTNTSTAGAVRGDEVNRKKRKTPTD